MKLPFSMGPEFEKLDAIAAAYLVDVLFRPGSSGTTTFGP
jgi:hypothetical protein